MIRVAVYEYWLQKRKKRGKPILRRLQAPTPPNDSNPYNVFRRVLSGLEPHEDSQYRDGRATARARMRTRHEGGIWDAGAPRGRGWDVDAI